MKTGGRKRKLFGLAALGVLAAWLLKRKRSAADSPEGVWRDLASDGSSKSRTG